MQHISMSSWPSAHWEDLRKQARKLENDVDAKLVNFSKLSTQTTRTFARSESLGRSPNEDSVPLLTASDDNRVFDTLASEIEDHLSKLSGINDQMADCMEKFTSAPGAALLHTLQRHRDILQDYVQEFSKTKSNAEQIRAREELFGSMKPSSSSKRIDPFLQESEHIRNSEKMIEDQIGIAIMTKENLHSQRNSLKNVVNRLGNISGRFPSINNVVQRINFRKRRDAIILGAVIGICLFVILLVATR